MFKNKYDPKHRMIDEKIVDRHGHHLGCEYCYPMPRLLMRRNAMTENGNYSVVCTVCAKVHYKSVYDSI